MTIELDHVISELRKIINEKGYTEIYQNGENQKGVKKSAEVDIYNSLIKHYMAIMKQLLELLPKSEVAVAENIMQRFGEGRPGLCIARDAQSVPGRA